MSLNFNITSPASIPAFFDGPLGFTFETNAPFSFARPKLSAKSFETGCICTPSQPLFVLPKSFNCWTIFLALFEGMAKPRPILPPVWEIIALLILVSYTHLTLPTILLV